MRLSSTALLAVSAVTAFARSSTGDRILVVLEPAVSKGDYSRLWASLEGRGYALTFKSPKDETAELQKYGQAQYDHLIMFAPAAKSFSPSLTPQSILHAQFAGLNTLYLLSPNISEINRDTLREYDVEFADRDEMLLSPFAQVSSESLATALISAPGSLHASGAIISPSTLSGGPIVYPSGTVHSLGQSPYLIPVLTAPKSAYVGENRQLDPEEAEVDAELGKKGSGVLAGRKAGLVSAMQTRDNVRIGFVGSGAMFSDKWWSQSVTDGEGTKHQTGNSGLAEDFTKWLFQETGVVKVVSTAHHRAAEKEPREEYRIKDDLTYSISLATFDPASSSWVPFYPPQNDLQLDFTMLDPHVRTALAEDKARETANASTYSTVFKAPDRHGVFKFVVEWWRPGYTYIRTSTTASVVPFRHDEYPRFILGAYPFYGSAFSMSIAFLMFCGLWLSLGPERGRKKVE